MKNKKTNIEEVGMTQEDDDRNVKVAVLQNTVSHLNDTLNRVEAKLDTMALNYVTNAQLIVAQKQADDVHLVFKTRIDELEKSQTWVYRLVVGAVITAVMGVLLTKGDLV